MRQIRLFAIGAVALVSLMTLEVAGTAQGRRHERVWRGAEARSYVAELRAADPNYRKMMEAAEADMRAQGWVEVPDGVVVVELTPTPTLMGTLLERIVPVLHAQTVNKSNGRAIFSAWDDGNPSTWEGNIYGQNYTWSAYSSSNIQYSISSYEPPAITWTQTSRSNPEGSAPTSWHGGQCNGGDIMTHAMRHSLQRAASICAGLSGGCLLAGPGYWTCLGSSCLGVIAAYIIEDLQGWTHECNRNCTWYQVSAGVWECR